MSRGELQCRGLEHLETICRDWWDEARIAALPEFSLRRPDGL